MDVLSQSELVGFVSTTDLDAATAFYGEILGLPLLERNEFACVFDANGTQLRVTKLDRLEPAPYTVLGWRVPDMTAAARALVDRGVSAERFDGMGQDGDGVWTTPGGDKVLWFRDPDNNLLSLTQSVGVWRSRNV